MAESVKPSTFGRIRGGRASERPEWSGTPSINEGRHYNVVANGQVRTVMAPTPALAIRLVTTNPRGVVVFPAHPEVPVTRSLGPCSRCGNLIWDGDRYTTVRVPGKKPKTWTHKLICEDH